MESLFLCSAWFGLIARQTPKSQREVYQGHVGMSILIKEGDLW